MSFYKMIFMSFEIRSFPKIPWVSNIIVIGLRT